RLVADAGARKRHSVLDRHVERRARRRDADRAVPHARASVRRPQFRVARAQAGDRRRDRRVGRALRRNRGDGAGRAVRARGPDARGRTGGACIRRGGRTVRSANRGPRRRENRRCRRGEDVPQHRRQGTRSADVRVRPRRDQVRCRRDRVPIAQRKFSGPRLEEARRLHGRTRRRARRAARARDGRGRRDAAGARHRADHVGRRGAAAGLERAARSARSFWTRGTEDVSRGHRCALARDEREVTMRTTIWGLAAAMLIAIVISVSAQTPANRSISGVVQGASGPEAGVWVIAETKDLLTNYIKIVVTDDRGRFVVPDLPAGGYRVWVRGYGLVDSKPTTLKP